MKKLLLLPALFVALAFTLVMAEAKAAIINIQASGSNVNLITYQFLAIEEENFYEFEEDRARTDYDFFGQFDTTTNTGTSFLSATSDEWPSTGLYQGGLSFNTGQFIGRDGTVFDTIDFFSFDLTNVFDPQVTAIFGIEIFQEGLFGPSGVFGGNLDAVIDEGAIQSLDFINRNISEDPANTVSFGSRFFLFEETLDIFDNEDGPFSISIQTVDVPEPSTMLLMGAGLLGLVGFRKQVN